MDLRGTTSSTHTNHFVRTSQTTAGEVLIYDDAAGLLKNMTPEVRKAVEDVHE